MYEINKQLLNVLHRIGFKLVNFADKYNYPIPSDIPNLLDESQSLIHELNHPSLLSKKCSVCGKLNIENADFCCYCGSSLIITRIRQQDKSPVNATECGVRFCVT